MIKLDQFTDFLENLSHERLDEMGELYAEELDFRDPMNEARTLEHLKRIEADLFKQLKEVRFTVGSAQQDGEWAFVRWRMNYRFRWWAREIEGVSHLHYNAEGKIDQQHDFWDASFPIYGEFPPLGFFMKGIKKVLQVKP